MKKVILALAELYIDFELFDSISLSPNSITLYGELNYKTAKEVLRLNMEVVNKPLKTSIIRVYIFQYKKPHTPNVLVSLVENLTTNEDTILEKLKQQLELI